MFGGIATVYMATGAIDASIDLNKPNDKKFVVDNAPKIIILKEAGYYAERVVLANHKEILLYSHPDLYQIILSILNSIK